MSLPNDVCRCYGQSIEGDICQKRDNCIRYSQIAKDGEGWFSYCSYLCDGNFYYFIPVEASK